MNLVGRQAPEGGLEEDCQSARQERILPTHQRGSHIYLTDEQRQHKVTVPRHEVVMTGTLLSIIEQSGLSRDEFIALLD
jgi:hypothetical protein